jgi:hypothetical protein
MPKTNMMTSHLKPKLKEALHDCEHDLRRKSGGTSIAKKKKDYAGRKKDSPH